MERIATRWRSLSGKNDWEGLLDPLDMDLRRYIIHYGERASAIADAFNDEEKSKNCGLPRYAKRHMFSMVGLENSNPYKYVVKKYLYAATTLLPGKSIWLGYVAVATDVGKEVLGRRDILISWRGTELGEEWAIDVVFDLAPASDILGEKHNPRVHRGFQAYYTNVDPDSPRSKTSCRDQVLSTIKDLVEQYKKETISITVTGHSLGAALAVLNATDIVYNGYNKPKRRSAKPCLVTVIAFAGPKLGDRGFSNVFSDLKNLHVLRVENDYDIIPSLPPFENYVHVGRELRFDSLKSPYLKNNTDRRSLHALEVYLHGVAGTQGDHDFKLVVKRDLALVNKYLDGLKDEYLVVSEWWTEKNKSMIQIDDGSWVLKDHENDDD